MTPDEVALKLIEEGTLWADEQGNVFTSFRGLLKGSPNNHGYLIHGLSYRGKSTTLGAHRIVMLYFYGQPPSGHETDHINRVKDDNRLVNLRWATRSENLRNADLSTSKIKLRAEQIDYIRNSSKPVKQLARELGVCKQTIRNWRKPKVLTESTGEDILQ